MYVGQWLVLILKIEDSKLSKVMYFLTAVRHLRGAGVVRIIIGRMFPFLAGEGIINKKSCKNI
jgi:hypothetical protein